LRDGGLRWPPVYLFTPRKIERLDRYYEALRRITEERLNMKVVGTLLLFVGMVTVVTAAPAVPEIDASSGAGALALLSGGLLLLKSRRKR
jgi:hypothetical protein